MILVVCIIEVCFDCEVVFDWVFIFLVLDVCVVGLLYDFLCELEGFLSYCVEVLVGCLN